MDSQDIRAWTSAYVHRDGEQEREREREIERERDSGTVSNSIELWLLSVRSLCVGFLWILRFPPTSQNHARWIICTKLPVDVNKSAGQWTPVHHAQYSRDRFRIHRDPNNNKALTQDE